MTLAKFLIIHATTVILALYFALVLNTRDVGMGATDSYQVPT